MVAISKKLVILSVVYSALTVAFFSGFLKARSIHRELSSIAGTVEVNKRDKRMEEKKPTVVPIQTLQSSNTGLIDISPNITALNASKNTVTSTPKVRMSVVEGSVNFTHVPECQPVHQIVFLKTHKTASTTANTIIQRYGYENNLTFVIPHRKGKFSLTHLFKRDMAARPRRATADRKFHPMYNILANHARFNKPEMDKVVPNATYISILREPVSRFESAFGYYMIADRLGLSKSRNAIEQFFEAPDDYFNKKPFMYYQLKNGMMFNFGLDHRHHDRPAVVERSIAETGRLFDLVLLTEYFDESLILMKKLLCWKTEDILYLSKGKRPDSRRYQINDELREKIVKWNAADVQLYDYFNKTFWQKVEQYGPSFYTDLQNFRERQRAIYSECVDPRGISRARDPRETFLVLRQNASDFCKVLMKRVDDFVNIYRKRQGMPFHGS
ncbi:galactosylceramide sulfotransferase-like [Glandiceps talaboti]